MRFCLKEWTHTAWGDKRHLRCELEEGHAGRCKERGIYNTAEETKRPKHKIKGRR